MTSPLSMAKVNLLGTRHQFHRGRFFCGLGCVWFHTLPGVCACTDGVLLICAGQFLSGRRPVLVCGLGAGVGDHWPRGCPVEGSFHIPGRSWNEGRELTPSHGSTRVSNAGLSNQCPNYMSHYAPIYQIMKVL